MSDDEPADYGPPDDAKRIGEHLGRYAISPRFVIYSCAKKGIWEICHGWPANRIRPDPDRMKHRHQLVTDDGTRINRSLEWLVAYHRGELPHLHSRLRRGRARPRPVAPAPRPEPEPTQPEPEPAQEPTMTETTTAETTTTRQDFYLAWDDPDDGNPRHSKQSYPTEADAGAAAERWGAAMLKGDPRRMRPIRILQVVNTLEIKTTPSFAWEKP